jgi:hypothetical protein
VAPTVFHRALDGAKRLIERRCIAYSEELFREDELPPTAFADEEMQELVVESARAIAEALTDAIVPAMARLTRSYAMHRFRADTFFRGMRRLLTDLSDLEFCELRTMLHTAYQSLPEGHAPWVELELRGYRPGDECAQAVLVSAVWPRDGAFQRKDGEGPFFPAPRTASRLFHVLQANGLAVPGTHRAGITLPSSLLIEATSLQRIASAIT